MNWNKWLRQIHRWLSIAFTVTVIANFVAMGLGQSPPWVVYAPLLPLALLLFTGQRVTLICHAWKPPGSRQIPVIGRYRQTSPVQV